MLVGEGRRMAAVTIEAIFDESQEILQSHAKSLRSLNRLFAKCESKDDMDSFLETFIRCLKVSLIVGEQAPAVDRTIDFIVKFVIATMAEGQKAEDEAGVVDSDDEDEEDMPLQLYFVNRIWLFLLQSHDAKNQAVRYRVCQMVGKLLNAMDDDVQLSVKLYGDLQRIMILRLSDKIPNVRVEAAKALARLQEPTNECSATKTLLRYLGRDPHPDVRRAILNSLLPSKRVVVPVLGRTMDVKETVRKAAYEYLSNRFHIRSLTIAQRVKLLKQGLKERSDTVQKVCKEALIPSWCKMLGGDLLEFLRCLDVQDASEVTELALVELLDVKCNAEFVASFNLLGPDRIIREEILSAESVFYWRVLCEHLKKRSGDDEDVDLLEQLLPDLPPFCTFINNYAQSISLSDDVLENLDKEFICEQLIRITDLYDLVDEAHRKFLNELAKNILPSPKIGVGLVGSALKIFKLVVPDAAERAHYLMETIADIREPMDIVEISHNNLERRQNGLAIAKIRVEMNIAKDDMETHVEKQDFERAKEAKDRLNELEERVAALINEQLPKTQEIRVEKNDNFTLSKCLAIACGIFEEPKCKLEISRLHSLIDDLVLKCVQSECDAVRLMGVKALGLACQTNKDLATRHLFLFVQIIQLDTEEIRLMAFKAVFDLILVYGFESFKYEDARPVDGEDNSEGDDSMIVPSSADSAASATDPTGKLLSIIVAQLDSEITSVHTLVAEGLARLLFSGRVVSAKILSRLSIMYFNQVNADNIYLLNCLGVFFPVFAGVGTTNRGMLADAFLPTLRLLFKAPASSPLSLIDVGQIGAFFIQLTKPPSVKYPRRTLDPELYNPHDNLCIAVSNEILRNPQHFGVPTMVDFLRLFHLSANRKNLLKDISLLVNGIIKKLKDKRMINKLKKFSADIKYLLSQIESNESSSEDQCPRVVPETPIRRKRTTVDVSDSSDSSDEGENADNVNYDDDNVSK